SRKKHLPVHINENRFVIGDEFGKQRHHEHRQENPQRPVAASVDLEVFPSPLVERGKRYGFSFWQNSQPHWRNGCGLGRLDAGAYVHLKPPASRSRSADRSRCTSGLRSSSPPPR